MTPSACKPSIISRVSRASNHPVSRLVPWASAARTSARFVIDFEPGIGTVAVNVPSQ
ncbi:MAG: hypothetical protein V9G10_16120 [Candidatus Nanopelagicales bacterium]